MRQLSCLSPTRKLDVAIFWSRSNKLDSNFYKTFILMALREEHRSVFGSAYVLKQRELPVDDSTFPLCPYVGHDSSLSGGRPGSGRYCTEVPIPRCQPNASGVSMR